MVQLDDSRLAALCRRHGVTQLRLFGSVARGEDTPASDIDLIADFAGPTGFFGLIRLEDALADFFGRKVDLQKADQGTEGKSPRDDAWQRSKTLVRTRNTSFQNAPREPLTLINFGGHVRVRNRNWRGEPALRRY